MSVEETLRRAGIRPSPIARTAKLSGGQKRQAQFAVAICGRPKVLFLDEPTVGLDVQAREALWASIRASARRRLLRRADHSLPRRSRGARRPHRRDRQGPRHRQGSVDDMRALVARRQISCESQLPLEEVRAWPGVVDAQRDAGPPADHRHRRRRRGAATARRRLDARQARSAPGRTQRSIQRTHQGRPHERAGSEINRCRFSAAGPCAGRLPHGNAVRAHAHGSQSGHRDPGTDTALCPVCVVRTAHRRRGDRQGSEHSASSSSPPFRSWR